MKTEGIGMKNTLTAVAGALLLAISTANAADAPSSSDGISVEERMAPIAADEWVVSVAPYAWLMFYEGDMTINGQTVDMSGLSIFDVLDAGDLKFPPIVGYVEARKGNWGVYLDTTVVGLEFGASDVSPVPGGPVTVSGSLDFTYALIHAGMIYTAAEWQADGGSVAFDVLGGFRYTYYDIDLAATTCGPAACASGAFSDTLDWWDLTIGARLRGDYDNGWHWAMRGDVAGAEFDSDFSVQALANVGKDFHVGHMEVTAFAGYRFLYQDWSDGSDGIDLLTHGPMVGFGMKF